jgi:hypothetical protein
VPGQRHELLVGGVEEVDLRVLSTQDLELDDAFLADERVVASLRDLIMEKQQVERARQEAVQRLDRVYRQRARARPSAGSAD